MKARVPADLPPAAPGTRHPAPREGQTFAGDSLLARYASFVKLPHTLFALPFAGVGAVLAAWEHPGALTWTSGLWIVVAFTAARFVAMGFNRIVDRDHDALNPRTRARELPAGRLTVAQARAAVLVMAALFVFAAWRLNPLCGMLSPVALGWICMYSYTKRFTAWSHHVLGLALSIAPVGAYLAVSGAWSDPWWALLVLTAGVTLWVAGFDVVYAIQDLEFDRAHGLHSIPATVGVRPALRRARAFHILAVLGFAGIWAAGAFDVGWVYLMGVAAVAVLLHFEHRVARLAAGGPGGEPDLRRIDIAFFRANVAVSLTLFVFMLADRIVLG